MKDNLRDAAQAALETLEDVFGKDKIDVSAINNLRAALAEPVVKESLTTQPSDTPLTDALDAKLTEREIDRALDFARTLERELAAAIEQRGKARREMKDNLRDAAQAAYRAMIAAELSDGSRKEWEAAVDGLKAALAEPVKWIDENDLDAAIAAAMKECGK